MADTRHELDNLEVENFEHKCFIPLSNLKALMTRERVAHLLERSKVEFYERDRITNTILKNGLKVFAILTSIGEIDSITCFVEADHFGGELDSRLPLSEAALVDILRSEVTGRKFFRKQWRFLAPVFQPDQSHRLLDDHTIIPFLTSEPIRPGGFSKVSKVTVDALHHNIQQTHGELILICKEVVYEKEDSTLEEDFHHERHILSALRCLRHPNIMSLLTAYTKGNSRNFLFPVADGDLHNFLRLEERPLGFQQNNEIFAALWSLSSAIEAVHEYFSKEFNVRQIGCHYDIKPRNILYHRPQFLLSDFGLSKLGDINQGSRSLFKQGEGDYLAPECEDIERDFKKGIVGRASDIWSFGCVLSVILAYLRDGPPGVATFSNSRKGTFSGVRCSPFHAGTKESSAVAQFLGQFATLSPGMEDFRILARLIQDILRIDPEERPKASVVTSRLFHLAQTSVFGGICSALETRLGTFDLELEIEFRRLRIWGTVVGLVYESNQIPDASWLARPHSYAEYQTVEDCLKRCDQEVQFILAELGKREPVTHHLYYHLQRFIDRLWDMQPASERSKMASHLEESMLTTEDVHRLQETKDSFDKQDQRLEGEGEGSTSTRLAYRRIGLQAVMRKISLELAQQLHCEQDLIMDTSLLARPFTNFHYHSLSKFMSNDQKVLIEKMTYQASWLPRVDELLERVRAIASFRSKELIKDVFPVLECAGYYHELSHHQFGIVYKLPAPASQVDPVTLKDVINNSQSRTKRPSLSDKFNLASKLVSCVLEFHRAGWVHKNICAFNIVFFPNDSANPAASISSPYIIGFNYSRQNMETAFTDGPSQEDDFRNYQHPVYLQNQRNFLEESTHPRKRFRQEFEYYSVGLVLMEIGLWTPLGTITETIRGSPEEVRKRLLGSHISILKSYMGDPYGEAVKDCLQAYSEAQLSPEQSRNDFEAKVVRPISNRQV